MKKNMFTLIIAAAAMIASTIFVSCEKTPLEPVELPEVIESEVLDSGKSETVTVTSGTEGTALSYESWILVRQETKATNDNRITVKLENNLVNLTAVRDVNTFISEEPVKLSLAYVEKSSRKEDYVTIIDSAVVIKVHDANFDFDLELPYQVPIYDDGVTRQEMPCYRYEAIYSKEAYVTISEAKEMDGNAYACRLYHHEFVVVFGGKSYPVCADVTLRYYLGPANEPYLTSSELISSWSEWGSFSSIKGCMKVRHTWSDGRVTEDEYVAPQGMYIEGENYFTMELEAFNNDLKLQKEELSAGEREMFSKEGYVTTYRTTRKYTFEYNYFTVCVNLIEDDAVYEDGFLCERFEENKMQDIKASYTLTPVPYTSGEWNEYHFKQKVDAYCLGMDLEGSSILTLLVKHR